MPSKGISVVYWMETYPILIQTLADQTPGMTAYDVAEVLDDMDAELVSEATEQGECLDISDTALILQYMALV